MGSLAAGASAVMGTGAFSGEQSTRTATITSGGDAVALTQLTRPSDWPHSQEYTSYRNGHIQFDIGHLNSQSRWYFLKLVKLTANLTPDDGNHEYWMVNKFNQQFLDEFDRKNKHGDWRVRWFTSNINGSSPSANTETIQIPKSGLNNSKSVEVRFLSQGGSVKLAPGDYCSVGVCIDTQGVAPAGPNSHMNILDSVEVQAKAADHE
jgi:hypothetical protein